MRGNSLRFFQPSVFIKKILVFCAIFAAMLSTSCKQLASFEPSVDGARVVVNKTFSAPTGLTATQGRKQKISLEWTPVSGAKRYSIYSAKSATAEFEKIYETDKNSFDDKVSAGSTLYYKVCAVKSNGTQSAFSKIVKGTSLAQPVISGGKIDESSATISWFMENARGINQDNYEEDLRFEVFCVGGSDTKSKTVEGSTYECTFDNLAGSTEYSFYVVAYTTKDQQNTEQSPKVNKNTLTSYTSLAPTFNASEGTSAKGIWLYITLPEMVKVQTETKLSPNEKVDESYPLYFKVFRTIAGSENYDEVCDLYYNGTEFVNFPVEYQEGGKPYEAGKTVAWFDGDTSLQGGVKYEYKIISRGDTDGYDKVVCPEGTKNNSTPTPGDKASKAVGWKCALPSFKVNSPEKEYREEGGNNVEVLSYEFGFSAEWNDLGKAGDYKFAIKQNRKLLDASDSDSGNDTWLENKNNGSEFFDSLDEINSYKVKFGSESSGLSDDEKGVYSYTLYIVPKDIKNIEEIKPSEVESKELCQAKAIDEILVTKSVNLPKPEFTVKGGFTNKVVLTVSNLEPNVKYEVTRTTILKDEVSLDNSEGEEILTYETGNDVTNTKYKYSDENLSGNCRYSYVLRATDKIGGGYSLSTAQAAETLGTPDVSFRKEKEYFGYDSVTISFNGVLAAKEYAVKLGASGGFGGGAEFKITKDGEEWVGSSFGEATANVEFAANKFTVTINKPEGYNDATKAGDTANLTVTAHSGVDSACKDVPVQVNVLGPALLDAKVNAAETTDESISISWNKVDDAKGYLIRRVMYSDAAMTKVAENSAVTYYYEVASKKITADGDDPDGRVTVEPVDASFKLTDTYKEANPNAEASVQNYQEAQAKIAWGLPFQYVVLPVLEKGDFDFKEGSLALEAGGKVAYENLAKTKGAATWGYGLNLVAEKAMSGNKQHIEWEKPYNAQQPVVYRRAAGSNDKFTKFNGYSTVANGKNAGDLTIESNDCYGAFEYVVKYYSTGAAYTESEIKEFPPSLLEEIEKSRQTYDTPLGTMTELNNKGYLLTVDGFKAQKHPDKDYYEQISWNQWQYDKRAVGPDSMTILVQNNNIDADPHELVSIENANASTDASIKTIADDIKAEKEQNTTIRVAPAGIAEGTSGTTDGILKVLRDYRHNYTFRLERTVGESPITVSYEDYEKDSIKTAYRQITDEELVRAATLAMSVGIKNSMPKSGWDRTGNPSKTWNIDLGSVYTKWTAMSYEIHNITFSNCVVTMTAKSRNTVASFLKLDGSITGKLDSNFARSIPPDSYTGTITITNLLNNETSTLEFDKAHKDSTDKIKLTRNNVSSDFGNITPLPYNGQGNSGFLNDYEEWQ